YYLTIGWYPIPQCWPDEEGKCACGRGHEGNSIGKAPLVKWRDRTTVTKDDVLDWWTEWPWANIGILLEPSGLVDIAPDSVEWLSNFQEWGLPTTPHYASGAGPGH